MTRRSVVMGFALLLGLTAGAAPAQTFPSRPITLVVPFAPGASSDGVARIVAREMSRSLGQPIVVDNRAGGGGVTGLASASKAAADGYTIVLGATGAVAVNKHIPGGQPFDAEKSLVPIARLANIPIVLVASRSSGITSLAMALDRARREEMPFGTAGNYTAHHLAGELLASMTKTRWNAVAYRGSAPAVTDLIGGQLPLAMVDVTVALPHIRSGALVGLGVTTAQRTRVAPELPTISEAGVSGYAAAGWFGLFAPAGTPAPIVARLSKEVAQAIAKPEIAQQIETLACEPAYLGSPEFAAFISQESKKWEGIIAKLPSLGTN